MSYLTPEIAKVALPLIVDTLDEWCNPATPEWAALFQVQLELERVIKEGGDAS